MPTYPIHQFPPQFLYLRGCNRHARDNRESEVAKVGEETELQNMYYITQGVPNHEQLLLWNSLSRAELK